MHTLKAVIIGSGIAGLATAVRLAVQGYQVSVYEKNSYAGGKISAFERDGYHFDAGPSLFTQPQYIEDLFALAGESIEHYISWQPLATACKYFYENGKIVEAYTNRQSFAEEMKTRLNEDPESVSRYLERSEKLYENVGSMFLNHSLNKRKTWLHKRLRKALYTLRYPYLFQSLDSFNKKHFASPEAVQLFNRFATYNGSNPYLAPSMLSLVPHLELNKGTYYPAGGMISISNALCKLAKAKGVEFHFNSEVQRIIHHEGRVKGIVADHINIAADLVVSNSDVYFTYRNLLRDEKRSKRIIKQERSSSAVIFYWGVKKEFKQLQLHNIFFSKNYRNEFDHIFKRNSLSEDPTVYVNITAKMEHNQSPQGKENWFVMVNAPADRGQDWAALRGQLRSNVLNKLTRMLGEDIEPLIETEHVADPTTIEEETASYMGSLYGTSSNSKFATFFRHPNFSKRIKGLYFCGGSVHPGGGIPLCLKSAQIVSDLVKEDYR